MRDLSNTVAIFIFLLQLITASQSEITVGSNQPVPFCAHAGATKANGNVRGTRYAVRGTRFSNLVRGWLCGVYFLNEMSVSLHSLVILLSLHIFGDRMIFENRQSFIIIECDQ